MKRLDSVTKSPIFSHFGESLNGVSTVRAYNVEERFIRINEKKINENNEFFYTCVVCNRSKIMIIHL